MIILVRILYFFFVFFFILARDRSITYCIIFRDRCTSHESFDARLTSRVQRVENMLLNRIKRYHNCQAVRYLLRKKRIVFPIYAKFLSSRPHPTRRGEESIRNAISIEKMRDARHRALFRRETIKKAEEALSRNRTKIKQRDRHHRGTS